MKYNIQLEEGLIIQGSDPSNPKIRIPHHGTYSLKNLRKDVENDLKYLERLVTHLGDLDQALSMVGANSPESVFQMKLRVLNDVEKELLDLDEDVEPVDNQDVDSFFEGLGENISEEELDEALTRAQRIKRGQIAKRNKGNIQRGTPLKQDGEILVHRRSKPNLGASGDVVLFAPESRNRHYGDYSWQVSNKLQAPTQEVIEFAARYYGVSNKEAYNLIHPPNIVDDAGAWDDRQFVSDLWQEMEAGQIQTDPGFKLDDGAVIIDRYSGYISRKPSKDISEEDLDEALTRAQRIKRSQIAKRNKGKIQRALKKGKKKKASTEQLLKRAQKKARDVLFTKLLKGKKKNEVPDSEKERIEKKLDKMAPKIERIAKKLLPKMRKAEQEKLNNNKSD